jgi:hypothetical protein
MESRGRRIETTRPCNLMGRSGVQMVKHFPSLNSNPSTAKKKNKKKKKKKTKRKDFC